MQIELAQCVDLETWKYLLEKSLVILVIIFCWTIVVCMKIGLDSCSVDIEKVTKKNFKASSI